MRAVELLRSAAGRRFLDEDGNDASIELLPPLTSDELAALEAKLPCPLPDDARELLQFARGFTGALDWIDFAGSPGFGADEAFPHPMAIAGDGFGNFWVVDVTPASTVWGPVFYLCHDPPVTAYQCADVAEFIEAALTLAQPPFGGPLDDVHERVVSDIWKQNPGTLTLEHARASDDPVVRAFAESLEPGFVVVDLRRARIGDGFSWGRFGAQTPVRRAGNERLFAYQQRQQRSWQARFASWWSGR